MKAALIAVAALAISPALATAQPGPPPNIQRTEGVVTAITDNDITLAEAGGKTETLKLVPGWGVSVSKPISVSDIKPGSYLGTTNHAKPDGTGVSTEVHVAPPGQSGPGVDFVMQAGTDVTMTNGTVATVVSSPGGQVLEVNYGSGVRKVTVPPGTPIVMNTTGDKALIKPGVKVLVITFGAPPQQRQIITPL
jgi:hypothetical protein